MFASADRMTLMAMANWTSRSMNHETRPGGMFEAASSGLGDASVAALIGLKRTVAVRVHLNAGVSIPLGSIEEVGENPMSMGREVQLPYPMQLGSGKLGLQARPHDPGNGRTHVLGSAGNGDLPAEQEQARLQAGSVIEGTGWFAVRATDRLEPLGAGSLPQPGELRRQRPGVRRPDDGPHRQAGTPRRHPR